MSEEQLVDLIFSKTDKGKDTAFWSELSKGNQSHILKG